MPDAPLSDELLTKPQILEMIRDRCREAGSQVAWGRSVGITPQQVNDTLHQRIPLGPAVVSALGYCQVDRYVQVMRLRKPARPAK